LEHTTKVSDLRKRELLEMALRRAITRNKTTSTV
jgi:hypothetical protein